ncbi:Hpt domain-containing protein [Thalassotalea nanhaiensis]|uniref:Hpt domain-containing protein n=1 Tax=Thalassotalea nanhaiensis TaxID=3065648 RepID=A0ABY9TLL8_9GAMM|nr:Hpt domain-containing protein [Colwelliaceae bacterium SQ345]
MIKNAKIDLTGFWEVFAGDTDTAAEVVNMFSDYAPILLDEIDVALENLNSEVMLLKIHQLKGTIAYLGFSDISHLIKSIEESIKERGLPSGANDYERLKEEITILEECLVKEVLKE